MALVEVLLRLLLRAFRELGQVRLQSFPAAKAGSATTRVVIPDALVLSVSSPQDSTCGGPSGVTLAVTPEQASALIYTQEQGRVWLTLLPPNQQGVEIPAMNPRSLR